jgi:periplasmic protein TonB
MFSGLSVAQPATRRWMTLASFTLQVAIVTGVLVFPMLYPQNLPQVLLSRRIFVPASNREVRADERPRARTGPRGPAQSSVLVVSRDGVSYRPHPVGTDASPEGPPLGPGVRSGLDLDPIASLGPPPLQPTLSHPRTIHASIMMEGNLIHRVEPQYPVIAKQLRVQGAVVLKAIISRDGNIERVEVASGQTLLAQAARDAVQQWKYRPYLLNGEPIEVETEITVNFVLQR